MVYITGDCHADFSRFSTKAFPEQKEMTRDDIVIVCGDFGGVWAIKESKYWKEETWQLDWLSKKPFTLVFVDGNHENFDRLYSDEFGVVDFHGGKAHRIRDNVYHLMRGYVFEFSGKKFWCFGGASSHDIEDGILDEKDFRTHKDFLEEAHRWLKQNKMFRVNHVSWWQQEMPAQWEMDAGRRHLDAVGNMVDFIVTHCAPQHVVSVFSGGAYKTDPLTSYFNTVSQSVSFKKWFFGHYHDNANIMGNYVLLYEQIIRIV